MVIAGNFGNGSVLKYYIIIPKRKTKGKTERKEKEKKKK
jgi:hypothetical protein